MKRSLATATAVLFGAALCLSPAPAHARVDDGTLEVLGSVAGALAAGALLLGMVGVMKLVDRAKRRRAREKERVLSGAHVPGPAVVAGDDPSSAERSTAESPRPVAPSPASAPATLPASSWVGRALAGPASKPAPRPAPSSPAPPPR